MKIGSREFETDKHTYVMGILNVTPDSFSDGGRFHRLDAAMAHIEQMLVDGMDILDIGGESTRPGYTFLSEAEEMERVVPVIEATKKRFDVPISLDTYKSRVAAAGIEAGADLINDIKGLRYEDEMAHLIARHELPCCLMHNKEEAFYTDFLRDVAKDLEESLRIAAKAGIKKDRIILDPGIGFAKTYEQNLQMMKHLECLHTYGCPILLGASRKSVIGLALELAAQERMEGTLATTALAVMKGCAFVRVHDILENKRLITMLEKIINAD